MAEVHLDSNALLVSVTDNQGFITYVNDELIRFSGYNKEELIGNSQNILRHPNMSEDFILDMCSALFSNGNWNGIIQNRCKNGDWYMVYAIITKILSAEGAEGYLSIQFKPMDKEVEVHTALLDFAQRKD